MSHAPVSDEMQHDIEIATRAMRSQSWPGEMAEEMEQRARRINDWLASLRAPKASWTVEVAAGEYESTLDAIDRLRIELGWACDTIERLAGESLTKLNARGRDHLERASELALANNLTPYEQSVLDRALDKIEESL